MTDLLDQQITESLRRTATHVGASRGSFSDVRHRVRARRQRHVAAAVLPAVVGMAWLGSRPTADRSGAAAPGAAVSVPGASDTTVDPSATSSAEPMPTTTGLLTTLPAELVAHVLCVDATGQTVDASGQFDGSTPGCEEALPDAASTIAPTALMGFDGGSFIVPVDAAYDSEAQTLSAFLGLPIVPDLIGYLDTDLAGIDLSKVHVLMVISSSATTCTVPGCSGQTTSPAPTETAVPGAALEARITDWHGRGAAALTSLGFDIVEQKTDEDGVTKIWSRDPDRPSERTITITIRPGAPEVTPTTFSASQADGSVAVKYQASDGWIYEIELVDRGGGALPTGDQLLDIAMALGDPPRG